MAARNMEKRSEILRTAYCLFSQMPYHKVSLAMIAEGAGINKSLLQHYYGYKSDIMKALLDELLAASFSYQQALPGLREDMFQQISDFNMLFFKSAARDEKLNQFVSNSAADPELLALWINAICGWLRKLCGEDTFTFLQLRTAIDFSMAGTMHLYCQRDELGIDYRFVCRNHIRSILSLLHFEHDTIASICDRTDQRLSSFSVEDFLDYCSRHIDWLPL